MGGDNTILIGFSWADSPYAYHINEFLECLFLERFCKAICHLFFARHLFQGDAGVFDFLSYVISVSPNVLSARGVLVGSVEGHFKACVIIFVNCYGAVLSVPYFLKEFTNPRCLAGGLKTHFAVSDARLLGVGINLNVPRYSN